MSKPSLHAPPVRLIDDPSVSSELRDDVERAATARSAYDTAAGLVAFQAAIGAASAAGGGGLENAGGGGLENAGGGGLENAAATKGAGALATTTGVKLGVAAAGTIALILATVTFSNRTPSAPPSRPSQDASQATTSVPSTSAPGSSVSSTPAPSTSAPSTPAPSTPAPSVNEDSSAQAAPPALRARPRQAAPESPVSAALRRETAQLGRIRRAMHAGRAREAYRLAQAGHAEFDQSSGQSMLWHEREALAILALFELGRDPEGSRRARELLERFPNSAFRSELEAKLDRQ